jgi:hypothetical protein
MLYYDGDEQLMVVGQSCRHYNSRGFANNRFDTSESNISCGTCKNWNGSTCVRKAFDSILTDIEQS